MKNKLSTFLLISKGVSRKIYYRKINGLDYYFAKDFGVYISNDKEEISFTKKINLSHIHNIKLSRIPNIEDFEVIDLSYSSIKNIVELRKCINLKILDISHTKVKNIHSIADLKNLQEVYAYGCEDNGFDTNTIKFKIHWDDLKFRLKNVINSMAQLSSKMAESIAPLLDIIVKFR